MAEKDFMRAARRFEPRWRLMNAGQSIWISSREHPTEYLARFYGYFDLNGTALRNDEVMDSAGQARSDVVFVYGTASREIVSTRRAIIDLYLDLLVLLMERELKDEIARKRSGLPANNGYMKQIKDAN